MEKATQTGSAFVKKGESFRKKGMHYLYFDMTKNIGGGEGRHPKVASKQILGMCMRRLKSFTITGRYPSVRKKGETEGQTGRRGRGMGADKMKGKGGDGRRGRAVRIALGKTYCKKTGD